MTRPPGIDRREAVRRVALLLGGSALAGGSALWSAACTTTDADRAVDAVGDFTPADVAWLDELADTILPPTGTPGAREARVGAFMALMVTDTYDAARQALFREGMTAIDSACRAAHGRGFAEATPEQRLALVEAQDEAQFTHMRRKAPEAPPHPFRLMKELVLLGYFTSEIGCTQALRYVEAPGRFDPCVPYVPGETIWASHA